MHNNKDFAVVTTAISPNPKDSQVRSTFTDILTVERAPGH